MQKTDKELQEIIQNGLAKNQIFSIKTYFLSDYGEKMLNKISEAILIKYNRLDLMEIVYSSAKELIINATKANLKRVLFKINSLDINDPAAYEKGMSNFKENLNEDKIKQYKYYFKKYDFPVTATFYYSPDVLNIKVKNNFPLIPNEEARIREKFKKAVSFSNLIDFFMEHEDTTEGAGMGITMVGILLDQSGIDKHSFSLYSSEKYRETIAKLEIPLVKEYIPKRKMFEMMLKEKNISSDDFRKTFKYNYKDYKRENL